MYTVTLCYKAVFYSHNIAMLGFDQNKVYAARCVLKIWFLLSYLNPPLFMERGSSLPYSRNLPPIYVLSQTNLSPALQLVSLRPGFNIILPSVLRSFLQICQPKPCIISLFPCLIYIPCWLQPPWSDHLNNIKWSFTWVLTICRAKFYLHCWLWTSLWNPVLCLWAHITVPQAWTTGPGSMSWGRTKPHCFETGSISEQWQASDLAQSMPQFCMRARYSCIWWVYVHTCYARWLWSEYIVLYDSISWTEWCIAAVATVHALLLFLDTTWGLLAV